MLKASRSLCLDICDYENRKVCNLYDNTSDVSGQAKDVYVKTERNGWKELSFSIPSTCITDEGEEENFRIQYLIADYKIKLQTENETDWYIISEQKVIHNTNAKTVEVTAGHIAQLLKSKALDLEFSDEESNNTGTAKEILTTILKGTGWHVGEVANFVEDYDNTIIKKRSLNASSNTGAFRLIENLCELFDAKPIYHGEGVYTNEYGEQVTGRVVDIVPMNPFSRELEPGEIPKEVYSDINVFEVHYDKNLKNITRTVNTDTMVTRLYAYGSYGDQNGMCSIQVCYHNEYNIHSATFRAGTELVFFDKDDIPYYFTTTDDLTFSSELVYSDLDFMSRSYVWNKTTGKAYPVYKARTGECYELSSERVEVKNYFPFLLCFDYYREVGLLSDNLFQRMASYQQNMPVLYEQSETAARALIENEQKLSEILESNTGMAKLAVKNYSSYAANEGDEPKLVLNLDTNQGDHGVLYRTDYDEAKRNYFSWHVAKELKDNGDPVSGIGSVVYIIHNTYPITWDIAYVKAIMKPDGSLYLNDSGNPKDYDYGLNDTDPAAIVLHMDKSDKQLKPGDRFYLFCSMSMSGKLSAKQVSDEAVLSSLQNETTVATEKHPTYFADERGPVPSTDSIQNTYGWYYKYYTMSNQESELYFCYGARGETGWHRVFIGENAPYYRNDTYFFNIRTKALYFCSENEWIQMKTAEEQRIAIQFSKVIYYCNQRDMLYKGIFEKYIYHTTSKMPVGNYAFRSPYSFYWVFTTDEEIPQGFDLTLDTTKGYIWQNDSIEKVVSTKVVSYDSVDFPSDNELANTSVFPGLINALTGVEENSSEWFRTNNIKVYKDTVYQYDLPDDSYIVLYNIDKVYQRSMLATGSGSITITGDAYYARIVVHSELNDNHYFRVQDFEGTLYLSNKGYKIINSLRSEGELIGINPLMEKFADLADLTYGQNLNDLRNAQALIEAEDNSLTEELGDLLREGYWQEDQFVEGDEIRMYTDAMDNLQEISKPEITYEIGFLDLYGSNLDQHFSIDDMYETGWPDIQITDAVHLVDPDASINQWAYIDVIDKCYDQPWLTTLEINTKLSLIDQHDFTDVLTRIAEVAKETKGKQSVYKRAAALTSSGTLSSDLLEGNIKANKALILGGASNWWTDPKGNLIFEADDGSGAMMLTGRGILIADQRDSWGDWMFRTGLTGKGLTSDQVVTAFLSAKEALIGAITTDMIHASVGQELNIGSNAALMMYATVDGNRPAGGVKTGLHNVDGSYAEVGDDDSYIQIGSAETTSEGKNPAYINIMTGGLLNLYSGSDMNIKSGADLFIESEGHFEVKSGGDVLIASGGSIEISASEAGHFVVSSPNFNVNAQGDTDITGRITALTGEIAGMTVSFEELGGYVVRRYMYSGTDSMSSTEPGIYLGTDGVNLGGYLTVSKDGAQAKFGTNTLNIDAVSGEMNINGGSINISADSVVNISAGQKLILASTGDVVIGNSGKSFTVGSNGVNAYIYHGPSSIGANQDGAYFGTDGIYIRGTKDTKVNSFKATANGDVELTGTITARSGSIGGINIDEKYGIYTGTKTSALSTDAGFLISKDGSIYLGAFDSTTNTTPFQVTPEGAMTATSGTIGGWTINQNSLTGSSTGLAKTINKDDIAFWAGNNTPASANFYVTQGGHLETKDITASKGTIGSWKVGQNSAHKGLLESVASGSAYVGLDGSNDLYPLSGASNPTHMYAIWAGNKDPEKAPFSVTKDGIVTIQKLRVYKGNGQYINDVDLHDLGSISTDGSDYSYDHLFSKLKFQTVKRVSQNKSTGEVTIYVTDNSGGTSSWGFSTATSVHLNPGGWSSDYPAHASAVYTASCYYMFGGKKQTVRSYGTAGVTAAVETSKIDPDTNDINVYGYTREEGSIEKLQNDVLFSWHISTVVPDKWSDHEKIINVRTYHERDYKTLTSVKVSAKGVYENGWTDGCNQMYLDPKADQTIEPGKSVYIYLKGPPTPTSGTYIQTWDNVKVTAKTASINVSTVAGNTSAGDSPVGTVDVYASTKSISFYVNSTKYYINVNHH